MLQTKSKTNHISSQNQRQHSDISKSIYTASLMTNLYLTKSSAAKPMPIQSPGLVDESVIIQNIFVNVAAAAKFIETFCSEILSHARSTGKMNDIRLTDSS